jgi:SAM-dependent methyltransferase
MPIWQARQFHWPNIGFLSVLSRMMNYSGFETESIHCWNPQRVTSLDFGCNNGYGTSILAERSTSAVGVNVSPQALDVARRQHENARLTFQKIDGLQFPFPAAYFDVLTAFQVIKHLSEPAVLLKEIRRVLRPDGQALFTTPQAAIRFDPGMRPWNGYHVREYRSGTAQRVVCSVRACPNCWAHLALMNCIMERQRTSHPIARQLLN